MTRDAVIVIYSPAADEEGRIVWCNAAFRTRHRMAEDKLLGQRISSIFDPEQHGVMLKAIKEDQAIGQTGENSEVLCRRADGSTYWGTLQILYAPRDESGGRFSAGIIRDISQLKEREAAANEALAQHAKMAERANALWSRLVLAIDTIDAPMGIWDKNQRLVLCNKAFGPRLMGRDLETEPDLPFADFIKEAAHSGQFVDAIDNEEAWIAAATESAGRGEINDLTRYTDGRTFLAKSEHAPNGDMVVHNIDMTEALARQAELRQKNEELDKARQGALERANRDDLTRLGNRRSVSERLSDLSAARQAHGGDIAVLQIDLDRFKQINDTLGHAAGDLVLCEIATRLKAIVEPGDHVARIGGDEFLVLRKGTDPLKDALQLGSRIVDVLSRPVRYQEGDLRVGASVGISNTPLSGESDLLVHADVALYRAKSEGRGTVRAFDQSDLDEMRRAKAAGDEIYAAIEARRFVPWYQPQIDARTGRIVGLEALARWNHPEKGILPPAAFLKYADDSNLLADIDAQIFDAAIEECSTAIAGVSPLDLSFNASEERLMGGQLNAFIERAAEYEGKVSVELLETIFMEDRNDSFRFQLDRLRAAGIGVEIDDFGSGRASIVALEQVAPDRLKIDRRLVESVAKSERSARLLRSIVEIGEALDIEVTAEGVETADQAETLVRLGCSRLQGYYFGRPMPLADVLRNFTLDAKPSRYA